MNWLMRWLLKPTINQRVEELERRVNEQEKVLRLMVNVGQLHGQSINGILHSISILTGVEDER